MTRRIGYGLGLLFVLAWVLLGLLGLLGWKSHQRPQWMSFETGGGSDLVTWILRGRIGFHAYFADRSGVRESPKFSRGRDWFDPRQPDPPAFGWTSTTRYGMRHVQFWFPIWIPALPCALFLAWRVGRRRGPARGNGFDIVTAGRPARAAAADGEPPPLREDS